MGAQQAGPVPFALSNKRAKLLAAIDEEDARLAAALEEEAFQPRVPPYRYDVRNRIPRGHRPPAKD